MKKIYSFVFLALFLTAGQAVAQKQLYFGAGGTGLSTWFINQNNYGYQDLDIKAGISYGFNANRVELLPVTSFIQIQDWWRGGEIYGRNWPPV
jgi:hypothetical protein